MCLAVPGKLIRIEGKDPLFAMGTVDFGATSKEVSLACVPEVQLGQYLLVHAGIAISIIDESHANSIFDTINTLQLNSGGKHEISE